MTQPLVRTGRQPRPTVVPSQPSSQAPSNSGEGRARCHQRQVPPAADAIHIWITHTWILPARRLAATSALILIGAAGRAELSTLNRDPGRFPGARSGLRTGTPRAFVDDAAGDAAWPGRDGQGRRGTGQRPGSARPAPPPWMRWRAAGARAAGGPAVLRADHPPLLLQPGQDAAQIGRVPEAG